MKPQSSPSLFVTSAFVGAALLIAATRSFAGIDTETSTDAPAWVYVISVGAQPKPASQHIRYANVDANDVADRFRSAYSANLDVQVLTGVHATTDAIRAAIENVAQKARRGDLFVFYFAGSSQPIRNSLHTDTSLLGYSSDAEAGSEPANKRGLANISLQELRRDCERIQAQRQLVVIDAAMPGGVANELFHRANDSAAESDFSAPCLTVIAPEGARAEDSSRMHGGLTYSLLKAIGGEAYHPFRHGVITARDIAAFVGQQVLMDTNGQETVRVANSGADFPVLPGSADTGPERSVRAAPAPTNVSENIGLDTVAIKFGRDFALIFETDTYNAASGFASLPNCRVDADKLHNVLHDLYGFDSRVFRNYTHSQIRHVITEYEARANQKGDQLLVYFASHGARQQGVELLVTSDTCRDTEGGANAALNPDTCLDTEWIKRNLRESACPHILLVLDACEGGAAADLRANLRYEPSAPGVRLASLYPSRTLTMLQLSDSPAMSPDQVVTSAGKIMRDRSRRLLTSGGIEAVSEGPVGEGSPFANALFLKLQAANEIVTGSDLKKAVMLDGAKSTPIYIPFDNSYLDADFVFVPKRFGIRGGAPADLLPQPAPSPAI